MPTMERKRGYNGKWLASVTMDLVKMLLMPYNRKKETNRDLITL
uniref:Uncharacterized protein n=1 Tax=Chenopodium quinoa TaxID=63459 RepID=A0A803NC68_CHEQI